MYSCKHGAWPLGVRYKSFSHVLPGGSTVNFSYWLKQANVYRVSTIISSKTCYTYHYYWFVHRVSTIISSKTLYTYHYYWFVFESMSRNVGCLRIVPWGIMVSLTTACCNSCKYTFHSYTLLCNRINGQLCSGQVITWRIVTLRFFLAEAQDNVIFHTCSLYWDYYALTASSNCNGK